MARCLHDKLFLFLLRLQEMRRRPSGGALFLRKDKAAKTMCITSARRPFSIPIILILLPVSFFDPYDGHHHDHERVSAVIAKKRIHSQKTWS